MTGGAAGIGRAYAGRLVRDGAAVAVLDRADAGEVVQDLRAAGGQAIAVRTDLTDPDATLSRRPSASPEEIGEITCGGLPSTAVVGWAVGGWSWKLLAANLFCDEHFAF